MAHYRVIPFLPQLPADGSLDKRKLTAPGHESASDSSSVGWLIPLLIMTIAALSLVLAFIG